MIERLLTIKEIAKILSIRPKTIYQWKWLKKNLTFVKIGRSLRVSERDLIEFIKKGKKQTIDCSKQRQE